MKDDQTPNLDDVLVPTEQVHPDQREHAKEPKHLDDAELDARTEHEQKLIDNPPTQ